MHNSYSLQNSLKVTRHLCKSKTNQLFLSKNNNNIQILYISHTLNKELLCSLCIWNKGKRIYILNLMIWFDLKASWKDIKHDIIQHKKLKKKNSVSHERGSSLYNY